MHLHFKNPEAAEVLLHMNQGTRMSLEVTDIGKEHVTFRLNLMLNGKALMCSDEVVSMRVGDTVEVPHAMEIQFSTV